MPIMQSGWINRSCILRVPLHASFLQVMPLTPSPPHRSRGYTRPRQQQQRLSDVPSLMSCDALRGSLKSTSRATALTQNIWRTDRRTNRSCTHRDNSHRSRRLTDTSTQRRADHAGAWQKLDAHGDEPIAECAPQAAGGCDARQKIRANTWPVHCEWKPHERSANAVCLRASEYA